MNLDLNNAEDVAIELSRKDLRIAELEAEVALKDERAQAMDGDFVWANKRIAELETLLREATAEKWVPTFDWWQRVRAALGGEAVSPQERIAKLRDPYDNPLSRITAKDRRWLLDVAEAALKVVSSELPNLRSDALHGRYLDALRAALGEKP